MMSLRASVHTGVAIPFKFLEISEEIATPVCGLVRNDIITYWAVVTSLMVFAMVVKTL